MKTLEKELNKGNFDYDSERIKRLKEKVFEIPTICLERANIITESFKENENTPICIKIAKAFEKILKEMTIYINNDELLVGHLAKTDNSVPLYPEFGVKFLKEEIDSFFDRPFDKFYLSNDQKEELKHIINYWEGKTREDKIVDFASFIIPENLKGMWDPKSFGIKPVIYAGYRKASGGSSHTVLNYEKILGGGIKSIIDEAEEELQRVKFTNKEDIDKILFLQAVIIAYKAIESFLRRFSQLSKELSRNEKDIERAKELKDISDGCLWISTNPPRNFWEALQLIWIVHLCRWIESNGHSVTIGRLDYLLYKYYLEDISSDKISRKRAKTLICEFFIKVAQIKKIRPWSETIYKGGSPTFQAITLGGVYSKGHDVTNELSYLFLEVNADMKLPEPVVICRVHSKSPRNFIREAIKSLINHGGGLPSFFSDEVIIPALMNTGIPIDKAREYAIVACSEPAIPGEHIDHTGASIYINLLKVLEIVLYGGWDPLTNLNLYSGIKGLNEIYSFDDLMNEFKKLLKFYIKQVPLLDYILSSMDPKLNPTPFASALINYRISMGKDMTEGGGPNDNNTIVQAHGVPNVANSLAAVKKLVFEDKVIGPNELLDALKNNFCGLKGEKIRKELLKAPKFGNDEDYVDNIASDVSRIFIQELNKCGKPWRGGNYGASLQGLTANVPEGEMTGATPDGRRSGEALADNISPQAGTDVNGVTSMLKSIAKVDHLLYLNGSILNVKIHPSALKTEGIEKLIDLIITYLVDLKGWQLQFNIVSAKQLKDAQKNPENYRNLIVKVAGYSAQFISLDKKLQDQIILRTENKF